MYRRSRSGVNKRARSDLVTRWIYRYRLSVGGKRDGSISLLAMHARAYTHSKRMRSRFLRVGERSRIDERVCVPDTSNAVSEDIAKWLPI